MKTEVTALTGIWEEDAPKIALAGKIIRKGGLVAFPTETVYGLGGDALKAESAEKIYAAKGRPSDNPLIVHIADWEKLEGIAVRIPDMAETLAKRFWPGPLTMIFRKNKIVPDETTGGLDTVAVRMPDHPHALEFIRASGGYIAAPSANRSGRPSCTTAEHVVEDLKGRVDLILDGGPVGIGLESTIIDLTEETPCLLRPGFITPQELREITGELKTDPAVTGEIQSGRAPKAPGMKYRHYAPKGELTIVKGTAENVVCRINILIKEALREGKLPAVIASSENADRYDGPNVFAAGSLQREEEIARNIFAVLRKADDAGASVIYTEAFDTPKLGGAIMNRLNKAAAYRSINADE